MSELRSKTLSYHRAEYLIENKNSIQLAACIREAIGKLKTPSERTVARSNRQFVRMAEVEVDQFNGVFLHLTVDTPGEPASVVSSVKPETDAITVSIVHAPSGMEFMDGDAFLYIRENDVCVCSTAVHLASIRYFFQEFFRRAKIRRDAPDFDLMNAVDVHKLALLQKQGVKEIQLRGTLYNASFEYHKRKENAVGVLEKVSKHLKSIFATEHDVTEDGLRVALSIKVDNRMGHSALGTKRLETLARDIIEHEAFDDEYAIILKNGDKIDPRDIYLKKKIDLESIGKSVERRNAWTALSEYYKELYSAGILQQ